MSYLGTASLWAYVTRVGQYLAGIMSGHDGVDLIKQEPFTLEGLRLSKDERGTSLPCSPWLDK